MLIFSFEIDLLSYFVADFLPTLILIFAAEKSELSNLILRLRKRNFYVS